MATQKHFFAKMAVDAVMSLDQKTLPLSMIGIKKVAGGGMQVGLSLKLLGLKFMGKVDNYISITSRKAIQ